VTGHNVRIVRAGAERLADLAPVYRSLHDHHASLAPSLAGIPARGAAESWARRRERYEQWLSGEGAFLLLALCGGELVGYAVASLGAGMQTWASGERVGDVHDIAVSPAHRGRGVGTALLARVDKELAAAGIRERRLTVLAVNRDALRLYERLGMSVTTYTMIGPVNGS
jgi:ribosomal protein S18 acetylase RimI-like enzyme